MSNDDGDLRIGIFTRLPGRREFTTNEILERKGIYIPCKTDGKLSVGTFIVVTQPGHALQIRASGVMVFMPGLYEDCYFTEAPDGTEVKLVFG